MNDPASIHEKRVWELASILFDDLENDGTGQLAQSVRKSNLSRYWTTLVDAICSTSIGLAGSSEEKAVACLAGHRVSEACKHLLEGKNFRLATLVSLIGTSDIAKKDMKEQIKGWHDSKMLSEFSEPIRAMYELLSGNVCVCEGLKAVPIEDRLDSFVISKKFGLDWKQAFGLRLWYAISQQEDLSVAVQQFLADIQQDKEALPQPWYREQGISPLWDDDKTSQRQDLLWGLLQLYADPKADLEAILRPENSQLSPLDMRLTWQLGVALVATGKVSFGSNGNQKSDAASVAYASQLTSAGEWVEAIFVLLHLSESLARKKAVQEHLCRHAGLIDVDLEGNFTLLTEKYQIPAPWIWEALALYNRSVKKDATAEVQCLLKAGSFSEAHRILSQQVAPLAIIERGYKHLSALLSQFAGRQEHISDWQLGGEVYSLFLTLVQYRNKGDGTPRSLLEQLTAGLFAMNEDAAEGEIIRFAALSDMADETAKEILKSTRKKQVRSHFFRPFT
jgi:nuclear pore complex protein Nup98-Nup96